jgi:hypothetical protein
MTNLRSKLIAVFDEYTMRGLSAFTNGKQIVVTTHLANGTEKCQLRDIWDKFAVWQQDVEPILPEEDRLFATELDGKKVWVVEDAKAYTIMYPEDY